MSLNKPHTLHAVSAMFKRPRHSQKAAIYRRQTRRTEFTCPGAKPTLTIYTVDATEREGLLCTAMAHLLSHERDADKALDQYISFIMGWFRKYREKLLNAITLAGFNIRQVNLAAHPFLETDEGAKMVESSEHKLLTKLGQLLFIPYMDGTTDNYNDFFVDRTEELCSFTGMGSNKIGFPATLNTVIGLKRKIAGLGGGFKESLLNIIREPEFEAKEFVGVFAYVLGILEWIDMDPYTSVVNVLVRSSSPVLFRPDVQFEVDNLVKAMDAVESIEKPEYFSVYATPSERSLIQRNRFPTLFAVAVTILKARYPSLKQVVNLTNVDKNRVAALADLHNAKVKIHD